MTRHIIAEGESDKLLLTSVLKTADDLGEFDIIAAGGKSSAISMARSLLAVTDSAVGLVVDADTTDEDGVNEQRQFIIESLAMVAPPERYAVFQAVPEIEICFFDTPAVIAEFLGAELPSDLRLRARFEPGRVLVERATRRQVVSGAKDHLFRYILSARNVSLLAEAPLMKQIIMFLRQPSQPPG
jgi:hypothetical protein